MSDINTTSQNEFVINQILTLRQFECTSDLIFPEESHDYWEFICVNKGSVIISTQNDTCRTLQKDCILFLRPQEQHRILSDGIAASTLTIVGLDSKSPSMNFFTDKILELGPVEQVLLNYLIKEARFTFSDSLDDPFRQALHLRTDRSVPFGSSQLLFVYLQQFLIQLVRNNLNVIPAASMPKTDRQRDDDELFYRIAAYMEEHIKEQLTIQQICHDNLIGRSLLQRILKEYTGCSVLDYFINLKINVAKQLIHENRLNFSQIAEKLGYNSIHYFSRQFKKITGVSPSDYQTFIQVMSKPPEK